MCVYIYILSSLSSLLLHFHILNLFVGCKLSDYKIELQKNYPDKIHRWYPPTLDINHRLSPIYIKPGHIHQSLKKKIGTDENPIKFSDELCKTVGHLPSGSRAAILGEAGFGKSTALSQLTLAWKDGNEYLKKFELVLLIPLKYIRSNSIGTILCENLKLLPKGEANDFEALQKWKSKSEKILFLFDGYEELKEIWQEAESNIRELIEGNIFSSSTVVVAGRPHGMLQSESLLPQNCLEIIQLQPFTMPNMTDFISKRLKINEIAANVKLDEIMMLLPTEISQIPLYLDLMCVLYDERRTNMQYFSYPSKPLTRTDLFVSIIEICMKTYQEKNGQKASKDFNLKCFKKCKDNKLKRLIETICEVSYDALMSIETFDILDKLDLEECEKLGFFHVPDISEVKITFSHNLVRDFFAAYYLTLNTELCCNLLKERNMKLSDASVKCGLKELFGSLSDMFLFMAGLDPNILSLIAREIKVYVRIFNAVIPCLTSSYIIDDLSINENINFGFESHNGIDLSYESSLLHETKTPDAAIERHCENLVKRLATKQVVRSLRIGFDFLNLPPSPEIQMCILRFISDSDRLKLLSLAHGETLNRSTIPLQLSLPPLSSRLCISDPFLLFSLNKIRLIETPGVTILNLYVPIKDTLEAIHGTCSNLVIKNCIFLVGKTDDFPYLKESCEVTNPFMIISKSPAEPSVFHLTELILYNVSGLCNFEELEIASLKVLVIMQSVVEFGIMKTFPNLLRLQLHNTVMHSSLSPTKSSINLIEAVFTALKYDYLKDALGCISSVERIVIVGLQDDIPIEKLIDALLSIDIKTLYLVGFSILKYNLKACSKRKQRHESKTLELHTKECIFTLESYRALLKTLKAKEAFTADKFVCDNV